ncbi:diguanylate cyclase [Propionivibrio limicola]|uniref:diguanylate cyclase n=1 Tax=Propionivibrio limicola TaxID=167645 RepID=UPI0014795A10|nr:diguanylate cyclase [Propionivibrio limicola]
MEKTNQLPRILIVDASRMVRAMLARQIRDLYDYREESDGEAAWQVLVLDHSIKLVICSLSLPVLDGNGLLARLRSSRLPRLAQMPMLMIAGDNEEAIGRAKSLGASDFINRAAGTSELLSRVDSLLRFSHVQSELKDSLEQQVQNPETGLFTRKYIELQAAQAMSHALRHGGEVSVIVLCFDNIGALRDEHGAEIVEQLQKRFVTMLLGKVRKEDSLGHFAGSQLVVVAPGTTVAACESFANRLREAINAANVAVHGQRLQLSVSAGVANSPADNVASAGALIELAVARMNAAQRGGGNQVVGGGRGAVERATPALTLERALSFIEMGREDDVLPHLKALGSRLLPLLALLDRELNLGWALGALEQPPADGSDGGN